MTQDELKELLDYAPETGIFRWKIYKNQSAKIGDVAGTLCSNGYRHININRKRYLEHRLAWLYIHGEWPKKEIDHINGIKDDNRIENLREATRSENECNKTKRRDNTSGYKCIGWNKAAQKWCARIQIYNKRKHLGLFDSKEEAYAVYCKAAKELHGEFANCD